MPRGRKKTRGGSNGVSETRPGSQESSEIDAPKVKETKIEKISPLSSPTRRSLRAKITDYFSPNKAKVVVDDDDLDDDPRSEMSIEVPDEEEIIIEENGAASSECSEKSSDSDCSGKENDVFSAVHPSEEMTTRSRSACGSGSKMPLSSSTSYPDNVSPPPSPTKCSSLPTSPPTPHKIKLMQPSTLLSPAASALNKLKISLTTAAPKKEEEPQQPEIKPEIKAEETPKVVTHAAKQPPSKTKKRQAKNKLSTANNNKKVTEFFPIRRSERKPKTELDKEQLAKIEDILLSNQFDDSCTGIRIKQYPEKGRGIEAVKNFRKGEFVVEYSGDLIEIDLAKERENRYSKDLSTGCYMYYFKHKSRQYCVDATKESGRLGRLVNHSRIHPNLQTKVVMVKDTPRLILVAKTDIDLGTELLYDYGDRSKESLKAHPWLAL